ncbi:TetR/AcrR family transcriptional regulator [Nocardiopsis suaedae]|uniref:TetR family transcriptional regulator n=1 Tax=Nocardiopsis suaedae TaxID=3018444 RepID=A0ABT4TVD7_9ACTN|nr:TetR family transcriptional regulator [Nocardiopsis suaedae]MDA2808650.1 TetR family transcriptional regulator [Nocardiopsis suaedae]
MTSQDSQDGTGVRPAGPEGTDAKEDGRRARGERRRAAIIDATLRVIERDGPAGVTHRAVAAEAGIPASSAVYYFATIDELLVATLTEAADAYVRRVREATETGDGNLDTLAEAIIGGGSPEQRGRCLAEYELTLLAVRRPSLRAQARRWMDLVAEVARRHTDDPVAVRTAGAAADGLCLEALLDDRDVEPGEARAVLAHALGLE